MCPQTDGILSFRDLGRVEFRVASLCTTVIASAPNPPVEAQERPQSTTTFDGLADGCVSEFRDVIRKGGSVVRVIMHRRHVPSEFLLT